MDEGRSIKYQFVGIGYGGCRIASTFMKEHNYQAYAVNTAKVDLGKIQVPKNNKLLIDSPLDGVGKDVNAGENAFNNNIGNIRDFIKLHEIDKSEYVILCVGGGGGTGTGGAIPTARILLDEGIDVGMIITLPLESEDAETKRNCLMAIKRIYDIGEIKPIIIVDNSKISIKYPNLSIADFWTRANKDIALTFHMINRVSSQKGLIFTLDPADYRKIIYTKGCLVMGETTLKEFQNRSKLSESLRDSISKGLYASDFDLSTAAKVGIVLRGTPSVFNKIVEKDITFAFQHIKEVTKARTIYWGIYADHSYKDRIRVQSVFSGLNLPVNRIKNLIDETKSEMEIYEKKRAVRKAELDFDYFFNNENKKE